MKPPVQELIERALKKASPDRVGMVLTHLGVVRGTSRNGEKVEGMELSYDADKLSKVVEEALSREGIEAVEVWINSGSLKVGDPIMVVVVAGRFRTDVLPALEFIVERIKREVVKELER